MGVVPRYAVGIHKGAASGDFARMNGVARAAGQHLAEHGNVPAALEALRRSAPHDRAVHGTVKEQIIGSATAPSPPVPATRSAPTGWTSPSS